MTKQKPTLDPASLAEHYGLAEETAAPYPDEQEYDSPARKPRRRQQPETSKGLRLRTLLAIGAVAASPFIVTKVANLMGNQEYAPWQHNHPAQTHTP